MNIFLYFFLQEGKEGIEKSADQKPKNEEEISGAESTRSTSRTREKSHRSDKVSMIYDITNNTIQIFLCKSVFNLGSSVSQMF